jgi:hypothetical protein
MVQETEPSADVPLALLLLYGRGDDLRFRLAAHRHAAVLSAFQQM